VGKVEFGRPGTEVKPLRVVEFTFLEQCVTAVDEVNNRSREFFRVLIVGQYMEQTLSRRSMVDLDEFAFTASEADAVSDIKITCAIRHC
jgi:hypothetical protein